MVFIPAIYFRYIQLFVFLFLITGDLYSEVNGRKLENYADTLYLSKNYDLAEIEYGRILFNNQDNYNSNIKTKLILSKLRQNKFDDAVNHLYLQENFSHKYLMYYSLLKNSNLQKAIIYRQKLSEDTNITGYDLGLIKLLSGTIYLEVGDFIAAEKHYSTIATSESDINLKNIALESLNSIENYKNISKKNPLLAGIFSSIIPGSGQFYVGHFVDGFKSLFYNVLFLGSASAIYKMENNSKSNHSVSSSFGIIGLVFYFANIVGAVTTAKRFNIYQERLFQQDIRNRFFNIDFIENTIEIKFSKKL